MTVLVGLELTCLRVVHGHELEGLTRRGWKVVETLIETELRDLLEPASDAEMESLKHQYSGHIPRGNTYYDGTTSVPLGMRRRQVLASVVKFLIGLPEETALADLENALDAMRRASADAEAERRGAEEATKKAEEALARMTKSHEVCTKDRDRFQGEVFDLEAQKRKLEGDIGRLRIALGDLRMKEILGGAGK